VLKVPPGEADKLTKLIPSSPGFALTIPEALKKVDELRTAVRDNELYGRVFQYASRIEGLSRHASVHAAGIVIAPGPLADYVPVCTAPTKGSGAGIDGEDTIICQYDMGALEKVGMLKMDFLGLRTLTVIHDAVEMIRARTGTAPDVDALSLDDPTVYEMLRQGRTAGVFQFESALGTDTLRNMKCDRFDDLVASNALLRPGPLDAGMHLVFIRRKLGQEPVSYPHPSLAETLAPTYGVITYQEQVMRIANIMAGFSLAEADVLRKAVGKKDADLIKQELGRFVARGMALGHPKALMDDLAGQMESFGRYGFVKSHSVAYSIIAYQTAWLKAHHPAEFMAALLSSEIGDTDSVVKYINEARELGITVLPPDVAESGFKFTVVGEKRIRFGLGAVRNVGAGAIESIIAARRGGQFRSLYDFVERIDVRLCNKRVLESLIAAGACDAFGHRAQLCAALDQALGESQLLQQEIAAGQASLFGEAIAAAPVEHALPDVPAWTETERLAKEKEIIGFFISGHPLERFRAIVQLVGTRTTATLGEWDERPVAVAAVVTALKRQISKKTGKEYARITLEDFHGTAEAIVFPEAWAKLNQVIRVDSAMLLTGGYSPRDRGEEVAPFVIEGARELAEMEASGSLAVTIRWIDPSQSALETVLAIARVCEAHPGPAPLYIDWSDGNGGSARLRSRRLRVGAGESTLRALRDLFGGDAVSLIRAE
jgi:DNA polymerase-3 subunit alpha